MRVRICLNCNRKLDAETIVTNEADHAVNPGDVSICFYCGAIAIFTETGLRHPRIEEYQSLREAMAIRDKMLAYKAALRGGQA